MWENEQKMHYGPKSLSEVLFVLSRESKGANMIKFRGVPFTPGSSSVKM